MAGRIFILYEDGCSGRFYKTFETSENLPELACTLIGQVVPWIKFDNFVFGDVAIYVDKFGMVDFETTTKEVMEKADGHWIIDIKGVSYG